MTNSIFTGVCTALVTPFLGNKVNYPMLDQLLRRQINAKIPAVVLCGTTGESATLSDMEKIEIFGRGKAYAGDQCKIIVIDKCCFLCYIINQNLCLRCSYGYC